MNDGSSFPRVAEQLEQQFEEFLNELIRNDGLVALEKYPTAQSIDVKLFEFRALLSQLSPDAEYLLLKFDKDENLQSGNANLGLKTLVAYCKSTLKLLHDGVIHGAGTVIPPPNFVLLTRKMPGLAETLNRRWKEAQTSLNTGACLSAILLTASILEALLLCRASERLNDISRSNRAPRNKDGTMRPLPQWNLSELVAVSLELGWLKTTPADYPLEMRKFRDLLHSWAEVSNKFNIEIGSALDSWNVLNTSIDDLLKTS